MVHLTTSLWVKYYKYSLNWLKMFKGSMVLRISTRKSKRSTYGPPPPSGDNEENAPRTSQFLANPQEAFIPLTLSEHPKASLKAEIKHLGGPGGSNQRQLLPAHPSPTWSGRHRWRGRHRWSSRHRDGASQRAQDIYYLALQGKAADPCAQQFWVQIQVCHSAAV